MAERDRSRTGGGLAQLAAGAGLAAAAPDADRYINRARDKIVIRQRDRASGTLGAIDHTGSPRSPLELSNKRGRNRADGTRYPSPRAEGRARYGQVRAPYNTKLATPLLRGRAGTAARVATMGAGLALAGRGAYNVGSARGERIAKADEGLFDLSPQYGLGIPATRRNPISPLAMLASSSIMADFIVGAQGRHLSRGEKKAIRRGAYSFAGASGLLTQGVSGRNQVSR